MMPSAGIIFIKPSCTQILATGNHILNFTMGFASGSFCARVYKPHFVNAACSFMFSGM
jgi:hypothetical protein